VKSSRILRLVSVTAASIIGAMAVLAGPGASPGAAAASCPATPCLRVDAIPGGGVDDAASVSGTFTVDIVLEGGNDNIAAFNFNLAYDRQVLRAGIPTNAGLESAGFLCDSPPPTGAIDPRRVGEDPATDEAFFSCYQGPDVQTLHDGPVARVPFTLLAPGTSSLHLLVVAAADNNSVTQISCDPEGTSAGACTDASVSTSGGGPPPPPPPSGDQCAVTFALDGETVQCADGSRVRFVGVASPLGNDAGSAWATALTQWFMAGKTLTLETDAAPFDQFGSRYGYAHVIGTDGADYNISALLIFVGMAHHLSDGVNVRNDAWFDAAQVWARTACWNMWAPGNPFAGESGCR
jgi:hypothetical protein